MTKALFFSLPGYGHVRPSLPLVAELSQRGHEITYFATESYRARIEAAGAVFQAYLTVQDDYFDARGLHGGVPQKVAYHLVNTAEEILPDLLAAARAAQPDYILYDGMCPWGYYIARILGVPAVVSLALLAPGSPPPLAMLNREMLSFVVPMLLRDFGKGLEANRRSRALAAKYGVAPLGFTSLLNVPGDLVLCYTSSYFQPFADTVPGTVRFVGWTPDETPASRSFSFEDVRGRSLIYVSLGTLNNKNAVFFQTCIEAFAGREEFVLMTTGNAFGPDAFGRLPENIAVHSWVPQSEVLKQAALFITHGGLNSIHDGLSCGLPLLLVPQQEEQIFNALRVVELGAGLMLKRNQVTAERLRSTAAQLLADGRFQTESKRIGDTLRAAGGASRAADEIESLLRNRFAGDRRAAMDETSEVRATSPG